VWQLLQFPARAGAQTRAAAAAAAAATTRLRRNTRRSDKTAPKQHCSELHRLQLEKQQATAACNLLEQQSCANINDCLAVTTGHPTLILLHQQYLL
jgi:hypothetical protein